MSQYSSWNKEGFNIVNSATRGHVKLDGLFNIVSYDLVTKLADAISEAQFKVIQQTPEFQLLNHIFPLGGKFEMVLEIQ